MYFLIIPFGFLLAMRGARPAPLQKPLEGLNRTWREGADFFLTLVLVLALWALATAFWEIRAGAQGYGILGPGIVAYLLSRYQRKTDTFFLAVLASFFWIHSRQIDLMHGLSLAWAVSMGIALFQTCFLGLRYQLLFSRLPAAMKGWPALCLLAGFIALVLGGVGRLVF
jgi:hypothetical protein